MCFDTKGGDTIVIITKHYILSNWKSIVRTNFYSNIWLKNSDNNQCFLQS